MTSLKLDINEMILETAVPFEKLVSICRSIDSSEGRFGEGFGGGKGTEEEDERVEE